MDKQLFQDETRTENVTDEVVGYAYNEKVLAVDLVMLSIPVANVFWATGMALRPLFND